MAQLLFFHESLERGATNTGLSIDGYVIWRREIGADSPDAWPVIDWAVDVSLGGDVSCENAEDVKRAALTATADIAEALRESADRLEKAGCELIEEFTDSAVRSVSVRLRGASAVAPAVAGIRSLVAEVGTEMDALDRYRDPTRKLVEAAG